MAFKSWLAEAGYYDEVKVAKVRTNVKPIHRKPTVHVPLTGGYTPAEEKVMQEEKLASLRIQKDQLDAITVNTANALTELRSLVLAITALSNVLQVLVTQAVPAKRGRPAKEKAPESTQEPTGATPAVEPSPGIDTTVTHSLAAAQEFAAKQVKPPAPEGLVHESITSEQKALAQAKAPPTLDELRTTFLDYIAKNGREAGIGKLKSFGIAKLGELPANEYAAFKSTLA